MYEQFDPEEFIIISLLSETNERTTPETDDLMDWASSYGLSTPVVADGDSVWGRYEIDYGIPSQTLIGPGAEVLITDGHPSNADIQAAIDGTFWD